MKFVLSQVIVIVTLIIAVSLLAWADAIAAGTASNILIMITGAVIGTGSTAIGTKTEHDRMVNNNKGEDNGD